MTDAAVVPMTATPDDATAHARRARFRAALGRLSRSSSADLVRWVVLPASIAVVSGFSLLALGWVGASRTHREIEQIPYLISGGLVGLALVFLGGLMLAAAFWVAVVHKLLEESEARTRAELAALDSRLASIARDSRPVRPLSARPR